MRLKKYDKLIFVDADDTSRAPMAATVLKSKYLLGDLKILSRGLVVLFPEPINQKAEAILKSQGYSAKEHTASQLLQEDFSERTLVLTMEDGQKEKIWSEYSNVSNVYTIAEYIGLKGDLSALHGEPLVSYGQCLETIEALINGLVVRLNKEELEA